MTNNALKESGQQLMSNLQSAFSSISIQTYLLIGFIIIMIILWSINYTQIYTHEVKINQAFTILTNLAASLNNVKNTLSCGNDNTNVTTTPQPVEQFENNNSNNNNKTFKPYDSENITDLYVKFTPSQ